MPTFGELWPQISQLFNGIDFIAAHNASFDKSVLNACCSHYMIPPTPVPFKCTLQLSRKLLPLKKHSLDVVSAHYGIELHHHDALSDTLACAKIMIEFLKMI